MIVGRTAVVVSGLVLGGEVLSRLRLFLMLFRNFARMYMCFVGDPGVGMLTTE